MNIKDRNLRVLNFTSWSLNGAVSSLILRAYYPKCKTIFTSYRKQEEITKLLVEEKEKTDLVIFTNFAPTYNREFYLRYDKPIQIFDHHENALWWKSKNNPDFHVHPDYSGAMMTYMYFKRWMADLDRYDEVASIADDFELWKLNDTRSFHFNKLFWKSESPYEFMRRWSAGGKLCLTDAEKDLLKAHVAEWKEYYASLPQLDMEYNGRFITSNEFHAEISKQMDMEGVNYFLIYHPTSNYVTFRSCSAVIDCKEILRDMQIFTASPKVGVIPCKSVDDAKKICSDIEKRIVSHLPERA